uniref:Uncharacterized protein n=1 Tax=Sphaerodactylus townsendi TaxID=933632 RepID=A0ACB8FA08_9SAUR
MVPGDRGSGSRDAAAEPRLSWHGRRRRRRLLLALLSVLWLPPAGAESLRGPSSGPSGALFPAAGPGLSVYISQEELRRLIDNLGISTCFVQDQTLLYIETNY